MNYIGNLRFEQEPNYNFLRTLVLQVGIIRNFLFPPPPEKIYNLSTFHPIQKKIIFHSLIKELSNFYFSLFCRR